MSEQLERVHLRGGIERVTREEGGRFYTLDGRRYWSVTTILQAVPKPWLGPWSTKMTATFAVEHLETIATMEADVGPETTIAWLKGAANRSRDYGAQLGTLVHDAAEAHALGKPYPEWSAEQAPFMEHAFIPWVEEWAPEFVAIEAPVFSRTHRYAGTLDAIVEVDGLRLLIDYKTTASGVHAENALQLASYRFAEASVLLPDGDEEPMPRVDGCAVVLLRPDHYEFVPVRADRAIFEAFLFVREVFRWQEETHRSVLGRAVKQAARTCAQKACGHHALLHTRHGCEAAVNDSPTDIGEQELERCPCPTFRATPWKREVTT